MFLGWLGLGIIANTALQLPQRVDRLDASRNRCLTRPWELAVTVECRTVQRTGVY